MSVQPALAPLPGSTQSLVLPTSFAQRSVWDVVEAEPSAQQLVVPQALRLAGRLDLAALGEALTELLHRHEALRTTFGMADGQLVARAEAASAVELEIVDLRHVSSAARDAAIRDGVQAAVQRPFDLAVEPLLRARVLRVEDDDHVVVVTSHLIAYDSWSRRVLADELASLYGAFASGRPSPLDPPVLQYADFANWQNQLVATRHWDDQLRFWRRRLDGIAEPPVPAGGARSAHPAFGGGRHRRTIPEQLARGTRSLGRACGATPFMVLLAAYQTLLSILTESTDITVGTPVLCRDRPELQAVVGRFVNYIALRTDLSGDPTFRELVERARGTTVAALAHKDVPFEHVVEVLRPGADRLADPFFRQTFCLRGGARHVRLPAVAVRELPIERDGARYDLELHVWATGADTEVMCLYRSTRFDARSAAALMDALIVLLELAVAAPDRGLAALAAELRRVCGAALEGLS